MPAEDYQPLLLQSQIQALTADFARLIQILESPKIPKKGTTILIGRLKTITNPIKHELKSLEDRLQHGQYQEVWQDLLAVQGRRKMLMEEGLEFLGGVAITGTGLDRRMAKTAQALATKLAERGGIDWSPYVIIGQRSASDWPEGIIVGKDIGDAIIKLPVPRWDIWHLPLIAHDFGYWVAKQGQIDALQEFVTEQISTVSELLDDPPPPEEKVTLLLSEIQKLQDDQAHAEDPDTFREKHQADLQRLGKRQRVHLWHLVADALATCFVGPAYAYALLFLELDPTRPGLEGEEAWVSGDVRNRYLPADNRRMAVVLHTLAQMDEQAKADPFGAGPFAADLGLLRATWEDALKLADTLESFRRTEEAMEPWAKRLYDGLHYHFGPQEEQTVDTWQEAQKNLFPIYQRGAATASQADLLQVLNAAWWFRARYPDRIADISSDSERLLTGDHAPRGLNADPPVFAEEARRLLKSWFYDLNTDLKNLVALFGSEKIKQADRDAVAGRFYRLLSQQDFHLRNLQKFDGMGTPLASSLSQTIGQSQGKDMRELRREVLDFLGGVLMRKEELDMRICDLAEAILHEYAHLTGVNWASRAILGANPLFSPLSEMIHVPFPDWDIWNLPLMAHEFGHVAALATPALLDLLADEANTSAQGHPGADDWDKDDIKDYTERRGKHVHEFIADAFAVYCLGPAFAYNIVLLHFSPVEAYLPRGNHPTHAERVAVILRVLEEMNSEEKRDKYEAGPYAAVIGRIKDWWSQSVEKADAQPDGIYQFHSLKARTLAGSIFRRLTEYYRLGAQYQASDWTRTEKTAQQLLTYESDLSNESLRDLLNIAWLCRVRNPDRVVDIAHIIRPVCEQFLQT
jgi:hypothetical protein